MNDTYTVGALITALMTGLGAFYSGKIMLTSNHVSAMKEKNDELARERARTEDERLRADRWMEFAMRQQGVTEDILAKDRELRGQKKG